MPHRFLVIELCWKSQFQRWNSILSSGAPRGLKNRRAAGHMCICVRYMRGCSGAFNPAALLPPASSDWPSCDDVEESCTRRRRRFTTLDAIIHGTNDIIYYGPATRNPVCTSSSSALTPKLLGAAHKFNFEHRFATPRFNSHPAAAAQNTIAIPYRANAFSVKAGNTVLNRVCVLFLLGPFIICMTQNILGTSGMCRAVGKYFTKINAIIKLGVSYC